MSSEQHVQYHIRLGHGIYHDLESLYPLQDFSMTDLSEYKKFIVRQHNVVSSGYNGSATPLTYVRQPAGVSTKKYFRGSRKHLPFFSLPGEIRRTVTDELFTSCRHDLRIYPDITTYRKPDLPIDVCLPKDFMHLLTSKQFFREAVVSFIRFTNIDLNNCDASDVLNGVHTIPSLKHILRQVLARSTQITIRSTCGHTRTFGYGVNMVKSLSLYVDKIKTINIYTNTVYEWVRLPGGVSCVIENNNVPFNSRIPHLRTPITDLERCEIQSTYPYTLKEDLQPKLLGSPPYKDSKELLDKLEMTHKEVSVYYWLIVHCEIDPAGVLSDRRQLLYNRKQWGLNRRLDQEPILLVIDVATSDLAHLKVRPAGSLRRFANRINMRLKSLDDFDINELLK